MAIKLGFNCLLGWLALVLSSSLYAHDIGVSKTELRESSDNSYLIQVQAGPTISNVFATPILPQGFDFVSLPSGSQIGGWKVFEFAGERPLQAEDTLVLPWNRDGIMLKVYWQDGSVADKLIRNERGVITLSMNELKASSGSILDAAKRYFFLGFEHILLGLDHLMFVLGLLWIVKGNLNLVKTITAFTVAHSITLGLATFGILVLPSRPVEACIALSIVFLAVEIIRAQRGQEGLSYRKPWLVAFAFGLLHGLGFAGALTEIGLPDSEVPLALLFFNLGVEAGQLSFVLVMLILGYNIRTVGIRVSTALAGLPIYFLGGIASYWLFTRLTLIGTVG
ncbi:HupE/UreJ family protein [Vibrio ulleungensis]|uniref:HupE/UreJ family protein n=1 Tax=Vibrio ulleungensis TaxID=2807619 RepID=A0ABS2HGS1_9VIBR|nr:HupE/UreJ family protein [Vibrio ulleungensis]MBM7036745.1 HupE/UreJ family protein [Vibrio ulleungensis]